MTVTAEASPPCVVAVEMTGFGDLARSDADRVALRKVMDDLLGRAFARAGIGFGDCYIEDRGDGLLLVPPPDTGIDQVVRGALLDGLGMRVTSYNSMARSADRRTLRLRVAAHTGDGIVRDDHGLVGAALNRVFRMLDAPSFRRSFTASGSQLGVIVSGAVRDALPGAVQDVFSPLEVQVRDDQFTAWAHLVMPADAEPGAGVPAPDHGDGARSVPFLGRSAEMARLDHWLLAPGAAPPNCAIIQGPPGVGKSTLARNWAEAHRARFGDVIYVDLEGHREDQRAAVVHALGGDGVPPGEDEPYARLLDGANVLLVLDGADPDLIPALAPPVSGPTWLITTRGAVARGPESGAYHSIVLGPFGRDATVAVMRDAIGDDRPGRESAELDELAEQLDDQPLAVSIASSDLGHWPGDSIADQIARLASVDAADRPAAEAAVLRAVTVAYASFGDDLRRAFRLISLAGGLDLTVAAAAELLAVDEWEAGRLLGDLRRARFCESPDGERFQVRGTLLEFARARCQEEESAADREAATGRFVASIQREHMPEGVILPDFWTLRDALSYAPFADAIAAFLRSPGTRPPLTIGIKGAWGAGKTTLMRMLRHRLDPDAPDATRSAAPARGHVRTLELLRGPAARAAPPAEPDAERRTTVWFNPWMYQRAEQVWAGLAHEIIDQVTGRMPVVDRERFWLRLNRARVDADAVRRRCYRMLAGRLLPLLVVWLAVLVLVTAAAFVVIAAAPALVAATRSAAWATAGGVTGLALVWSGVRAVRFWFGGVTGPLTGLLRAPGPPPDPRRQAGSEATAAGDPIWADPAYRTRTGYLHAVHDDVRHVLDLVATPDRPLVVFVDDLDRCGSRTVAEVIEALNLFLAGEFANCVFVIAMEPSAVAAHIEAAHPELVAAQHTGRLPGDWSSLGWRFLDKIVQLPLTLPVPGAERIPAYVDALLRHGPDDETPDPGPGAARPPLRADHVTEALRRRGPTPETIMDVALDVQTDLRARDLANVTAGPPPGDRTAGAARRVIGDMRRDRARTYGMPDAGPREPLEPSVQEAAMRVFAEMYDDARARQAITAALPVLGSHNPREIKRFVNLFRFYSYIALANRVAGQDPIAPPQLAKLTALVVRWPHLLARLGPAGDSRDRPVNALERAARGDDEAWHEGVRTHLSPLLRTEAGADGTPAWPADLRAFLARDPAIGNAAALL